MVHLSTGTLFHLIVFAWVHQRHRQCYICHTAPKGGTFIPRDTFYAPMPTISYLWHGRERCMQNYYIQYFVHLLHRVKT